MSTEQSPQITPIPSSTSEAIIRETAMEVHPSVGATEDEINDRLLKRDLLVAKIEAQRSRKTRCAQALGRSILHRNI